MRSIYILILPTCVIVYLVGVNFALMKLAEFPNNEEGRQQFSEWININPTTQFYIILDGFKESFHIEQVPAVWIGDQYAIIERRFNQFARESVFRHVIRNTSWLEGFKTGRIQYLLSAIPENAIVDDWLDIIEKYRRPVIGVYSISSLMGEYVLRRSDFGVLPTVLMCADESYGLRQFLFVQGRMIFYRVNPEPKEKWTRESCKMEMQRAARYFSVSLSVALDDLRFWYVNFDEGDYMLPLFKSLSTDKVNVFSAEEIFNGHYGPNKTPVKCKQFFKLSEFIIVWFSLFKINNYYAPLHRMYFKELYSFRKTVQNFLFLIIIVFWIFSLFVLWKAFNFKDQKNNMMEQKKEISSKVESISRLAVLGRQDAISMNEIVSVYDSIMHRPRINQDFIKLSNIVSSVGPGTYLSEISWSISSENNAWKVSIGLKGYVDASENYLVLSLFYAKFRDLIIKEFKAENIKIPAEVMQKKKIQVGIPDKNNQKLFEINFEYRGYNT